MQIMQTFSTQHLNIRDDIIIYWCFWNIHLHEIISAYNFDKIGLITLYFLKNIVEPDQRKHVAKNYIHELLLSRGLPSRVVTYFNLTSNHIYQTGFDWPFVIL